MAIRDEHGPHRHRERRFEVDVPDRIASEDWRVESLASLGTIEVFNEGATPVANADELRLALLVYQPQTDSWLRFTSNNVAGASDLANDDPPLGLTFPDVGPVAIGRHLLVLIRDAGAGPDTVVLHSDGARVVSPMTVFARTAGVTATVVIR
jgi:hypothetical protein